MVDLRRILVLLLLGSGGSRAAETAATLTTTATATTTATMATAPPSAPPLGGLGSSLTPFAGGHLMQMVTMLLLVLLLIGVSAWLVRRFSRLGQSGEQTLRYLSSLSVGQRERVVLIQVGETQLLLGVAPGRVSLLHCFDDPEEPELEPPTVTERFSPPIFATQLNESLTEADLKL